MSAATSSKSFMRSSQSQRWICTPNRCSASCSSRLQSSYCRLTHVTPGTAKISPHSSRRVYSSRRSAVWILRTPADPDVRARTDRGEPFAPRGDARRVGHEERTPVGERVDVGRNQRMRLPAGIARSKSCIDLAAAARRASARAPRPSGNERANSGTSRVSHSMTTSRAAVDEIGIHRREHDLVADALFAVHEHARVGVGRRPARNLRRRARCRAGPPWIARSHGSNASASRPAASSA